MNSRALLVSLIVALVFSISGCATSPAVMRAKLMQLAKNRVPEAEYRVAPPDQLIVEVKGYPEYSRGVTVRPDGKITVPSVGDIMVQNMTLPEINTAVTEGLRKELSQPSVTVSLVAAVSKVVFVLGEVRRPGLRPYYGDMTLIEAIASAEGPTLYADWRNVTLTRASLDPKDAKVYKVDLWKLVEKGAAEQDIALTEGDLIYVAPTPFAQVGYAFDQLLFPFRSLLGGLVTYGGVKSALE